MCASEVGADDRAGSLSVTCPAPTCTDTGGIGDPLTLRRGEIFALRWKDIDGQKRLLTVREASTTARSVRTKPKQDYDRTWQLLADWKTQAGNTAPDAMVFATRRGTPILPNNVLRRAIFPACTRLGLPKATWLTFRHPYSSWSHDRGVPGKVTAQLMGHASVDTTLNVYTQVLDGSVREAVEKVGGELFTIVHKLENGDSTGGG